jgi:hypothetical protein
MEKKSAEFPYFDWSEDGESSTQEHLNTSVANLVEDTGPWVPPADYRPDPAVWDETDTDYQAAAAEAEFEGQPTAVINGQIVDLVTVEDPDSEDGDHMDLLDGNLEGNTGVSVAIPINWAAVFDIDSDEDTLEGLSEYSLEDEEENLEPEGDIDGMKKVLEGDRDLWPCSRTNKYRHSVPIIQLSACPPPLPLLLTCKQLCTEALEFYYAKCALYIDATVAFIHFHFFEEVFELLQTKEYSFINQLRKVKIRFVWDSETISTLTSVDVMSDYMLPRRRDLILGLLSKAVHLESIEVHWHDTVKNDASEAFKNGILNPIVEKLSYNPNIEQNIDISVKEHFPKFNQYGRLSVFSLLGSMRFEFGNCEPGSNFR